MEREMIHANKMTSEKAVISYLEIFILVLSTFAISYIFYELTNSLSEKTVATNIETISAQSSSGTVCCEQTLSGNSCQTAPAAQCDNKFKISPSACAETSFCEIGCCVSKNTGLCNMATSRKDCEKSGGTFNPGSSCNIQACKKGCCILGDQAKWTTEQNCKFESNTEHKDLFTEWRYDENSNSELQCLFSVEKDTEGACVFESNGKRNCLYTTLQECVSRTGSEVNFARDTFCSAASLNTTCTAKNNTGCVQGKEDVYWFDSCGNREDVKEDCDLFKGSYCGKKNDKYICKDVNCDTNKDGITDRKNGESWCSYDGKIGDGKDPVGSRHILHTCYFGSERISPCNDFRNEICVQQDSMFENGKTFSQATCRVNQWRTCLSYNRENPDAMKNKCEKNPDCRIKNIDMGGSFKFSVCTPGYPPGFDLNFEENVLREDGTLVEGYNRPRSSDGICSTATQRCTETWQCGIFGCKCIDNCKCHTETFTREMNDLCVSLGDCGAYVNYIGEYSDGGYTVRVVQAGEKGPPRLSSSELSGFSRYAEKQPDQKPASPGSVEFFKSLDGSLLPEISEQTDNLSAFEKELLKASGSYGSPLLLKILTAKNESSVWGSLGDIATGAIGLSQFTSAAASTRAAIDAQIKKPDQKEKKDLSMIIAMVAALIAYVITQSIIIAMVAALLGFLFGLSWIKKVDIDFTCMPWEPPDGGEKCNECNKLDVPCTEYRCESLGSLCQLINKGTGNELCVSRPVNETLPRITPLETAISQGFKYKNVGEKGFEIVNATSDECIPAYTSVEFGISVDPFARCRISNNSRDSYEEMTELFGPKGNYILPAHVTRLFFPSPEAFKNAYNLSAAQVEALGKWELYLKCKTSSGKVNPEPYQIKTCIKPGPDITPPRITLTQPLSGEFIAYGVTEKAIEVYVNEPSDCRWSTRNVSYAEMENTLSCEKNPAVFTQFGWKCTTTLNLTNKTNFYIACQDTSENKNTMSESFSFVVKPSAQPLSIPEILPKQHEVVTSGVEPVSVKLRAKTAGGALQGQAICRWEGNNYGDYFRYSNKNGSTIHEYTLNLPQGIYTLNLICEDVANNTAEGNTRFTVHVDSFGPKISRIYYDFGLKVITSEVSECRYSFTRNFEFENATKMSSNTFEHHAPWLIKSYYIQCKDTHGNKGGIIKVNPRV